MLAGVQKVQGVYVGGMPCPVEKKGSWLGAPGGRGPGHEIACNCEVPDCLISLMPDMAYLHR